MNVGVTDFTVTIEIKHTVFSIYSLLVNTLNRLLIGHTVMNQISNSANFQAMFFCENFKIWTTRHSAIFFDDFTNHRSWLKTRKTRQVTTGFGMTSTVQYATWLCHQWEDMSWLYNVTWFGMRSHRSLNGMRTFSCRNTGSNAVGC